MKKLFLLLFFTILLPVFGGPKIAIFDEANFPNASKRDAKFYSKVLGGKILSLKELSKLSNFDILIFPHGGYVPAAAEDAVYNFMTKGKTIIICGDLQQPLPPAPEKRPKIASAKKLAFEEKYGVSHGGVLSLVNGRWIPAPVGAIYEGNVANKWFEFFTLWGWPNYAQSYAPLYMRKFDKVLKLNPLLKNSNLPLQITPPKQKILLARVRPMGSQGDHAFDVYHALYQFASPSGNKYPPFAMAGKSAEDKDADGFIYRKYRPDMFGATLVVMGQTGRLLLDSNEGEKTIKAIVALTSKTLPNSFPISYMKKVHALEKAMQDYNIANANLAVALKRLAVENFVSNKHNLQLVRLKSLQKEFSNFNNQFDGLMLVKDRRKTIPANLLNSLYANLTKATLKLNKQLAPIKKYAQYPNLGDAKHPYKKFTLMTSNFGPWHVDNPNWKKVQELGISITRINAPDWTQIAKLNKRYNLSTTYTAIPMHRSHPDKKVVSSGVFNPITGTVKKVKAKVWQKDAPDIDSAVIENLKKAEKNPGITAIIHGDERDFQWSLWGDYMQGLLVKYLAAKYQTIAALNKEYQTKYANFNDIKLPLKRPITQSEHALWEDWTRYREIYRQENELKRWVNLIKQYAPSKRQWLYGSYHLQGKHPANGINFYETSKWLNPATIESSSNPRKEVMTYDIGTFGKKHVNPEWAGFYFPAGSRIANMNRMREFLWNEANCGTISWHTFMGGVQSRSNWTHTPLITPNGNIQPEGLALRDTVRELNAARRFFLDGNRQEPEVRFVYSPTTRRHTSWPGVEEDRSLQCVNGYNEAFKVLHIPARGIDEQAIWEGKLPKQCRFLIVPAIEYMNRKLFTTLVKFMKNGGTVIATPNSGRFDEYGHKKDALLELAGVKATKTMDDDFVMFSPDKLEVLFPNETKVLGLYNNKDVAITSTKVGKGQLVICGYPIGREFNNTGKGLKSLQKLTSAVNISSPFICNDPNLVIRPWVLDGQLYLACYYIHRDTVPVAKGDFPLRSAPVMIPYSINIAGKVNAIDYLTNSSLKVEHKGNETIISGLIGNPGGCIIKLSKNSLPKRVVKAQKIVTPTKVVNATKVFNLPSEGKFFAEWGKIKLGNYTLMIAAHNDGAWQGKVFATLSDGTRTLTRECIPNSNVIFRFNEKTVIFRCKKVASYMPVHIEGTFTEKKNTLNTNCKFSEQDGKLILQNGYLYAVILPEFGGRIAELRSNIDSPNQLLLNEKTLNEGVGQSYRDFGGIEYNPGYYQGPGWQVPFKVKVLKKTNKEVLVSLTRSGKYPLRRGGMISYEIFYQITANSPFLTTSVRIYNEMETSAKLAFRTHPIFLAGGNCSMQDVYCWQSPNGPAFKFYKPGANQYVQNAGNYFAWIDATAGEGILQTFKAQSIPKLYLWTSKTAYNSELHFLPIDTPAGTFASFNFATAVITGLNRIDYLSDSFAIAFEEDKLQAQVLGLKKESATLKLQLKQNNKALAEKVISKVTLTPQKLIMLSLANQKLKPGTYQLVLTLNKKVYTHSFKVANKRQVTNNKELENLKKQYQKNPTPTLRKRIFILSNSN